jgi:hypothetical protein
MSLNLQKTPYKVKELALQQLRARLPAKEYIVALQGSPALSEGVPIYSISPRALKWPNALAMAKRSGWCFLIAHGKEPGTAVVRKYRSQWSFAGIGLKDFAHRFVTSIRKAETTCASGKYFDLRLLEIPAVHFYSIWLFSEGGRSRVLPLAPPGRRRPPDGMSEKQLEKSLKAWTRRTPVKNAAVSRKIR